MAWLRRFEFPITQPHLASRKGGDRLPPFDDDYRAIFYYWRLPLRQFSEDWGYTQSYLFALKAFQLFFLSIYKRVYK